jgi:hypothetical protein
MPKHQSHTDNNTSNAPIASLADTDLRSAGSRAMTLIVTVAHNKRSVLDDFSVAVKRDIVPGYDSVFLEEG